MGKRIRIPNELGKDFVGEGLYREFPSNHFFYLSREGNEWYFQFYWNEKPILITPKSRTMYGDKVDNPQDELKGLQEERKFIESKLASLAKDKS